MIGTYLLQVEHRRAGQDAAVTTHHFRWGSAAAPTDADFLAIDLRINQYYDQLAPYRSPILLGMTHRWYGPRVSPGIWGENVRTYITEHSAPPATATGLPQQVACSVTERTSVRRRWGRHYIPCLNTTVLTASNASGLFSGQFAMDVADRYQTALNSLPWPWGAVVFGTPDPSSLTISMIAVDTIPDVQRRRRSFSTAAPLERLLTITPPPP